MKTLLFTAAALTALCLAAPARATDEFGARFDNARPAALSEAPADAAASPEALNAVVPAAGEPDPEAAADADAETAPAVSAPAGDATRDNTIP